MKKDTGQLDNEGCLGLVALICLTIGLLSLVFTSWQSALVWLAVFAATGYFAARYKMGWAERPVVDLPGEYAYDDLIELERGIKRAIEYGTPIPSIQTSAIDKSRYEYLRHKYRQIEFPITFQHHHLHAFYLRKYEELKPDIQAGKAVCLDAADEARIREFVALDLPGVQLRVVRPIVFRTIIAGLKYHDYAKKSVKWLLEQEAPCWLELEPDPANDYDPFAVKILIKGHHLGFVPREYALQVSQAIDNLQEVTCWLSDYSTTGQIWERCSIEIQIKP